jgi:hypothetical protein
MHKAAGGLTDRERSAYFDQGEQAAVLVVLADDPDFQLKARRIAERPSSAARRETAKREAKNYVSNRGAAQELIAELLLVAAAKPWLERGSIMRDFFANLPHHAVWADDDPGELDARRVRERWETLQEGARALARFGAGRCIECGRPLGGGGFAYSGRGLKERRSRRTHCDSCSLKLCRVNGKLESQLNSKRQAIDVLTGRRRRHRADRRAM